MLSRSDHDWAEVDYFFAQVAVEEREVDFSPSGGNILSGVDPFSIEQGLVDAQPKAEGLEEILTAGEHLAYQGSTSRPPYVRDALSRKADRAGAPRLSTTTGSHPSKA
jgi:hypothetical protein